MKRLRILILLTLCFLGTHTLTRAQTHAQSPPQHSDTTGLANALRMLTDEKGSRQVEAINWLTDHPTAAHDPLMALVRTDTSKWIKYAIGSALFDHAHPADLPVLDSLVKAGVTKRLWGIYFVIATIPSPGAFDSLVGYTVQDTTSNPIGAMGFSKDPRARPYLEKLLGSASVDRRRWAMMALDDLGAEPSRAVIQARLMVEEDLLQARRLYEALSALPPAESPADVRVEDWEKLRTALADLGGKEEVRWKAIEWLVKHPELCHDSIRVILKTSTNPRKMVDAIRVIRKMATLEDLPILDKLAKCDYRLTEVDGPEFAIAVIQHPAAFDSLVSYCFHDLCYDLEPIQAMGHSNDPRARPFLEMMLRSDARHQRTDAIMAFRELGARDSRKTIQAQLEVETDPDNIRWLRELLNKYR